MAKVSVAHAAAALAEKLAQEMHYEFVDASLDKEYGASFLRIYVDKEGGITVDDCETFHRAFQPLVEHLDYDYLEISSPGLDRPLTRDKDFEKAKGEAVEIHLYRAMDGKKRLEGTLRGLTEDGFVEIEDAEGQVIRLERKACSLIKPIIVFEDEEVE
ncbi:MAG: ribosome maturation factor RimP [Clostridia bacterium]|nr:ribosome maturation factor RimP [Clostridia bacterium]